MKPMVSSDPSEVWPPTISAPASANTTPAAAMISASQSPCIASVMRGRITVASAACGVAPIAQMSPSAWTAAMPRHGPGV